MPTELTHQELSLLLFALDGGSERHDQEVTCEEACPAVDALGVGALPPEKQLARHLNNHLREGMIESGMFELMGEARPGDGRNVSPEDRAKLEHANLRLGEWRCEIGLNDSDKLLLAAALSRLPASAWLAMPRRLWRLRKKLRAR